MTDLAPEPALRPAGAPDPGPAAEFRASLRSWLEAEVTDEIVRLGQAMPTGEDLEQYRKWNNRLADGAGPHRRGRPSTEAVTPASTSSWPTSRR